MFNNRKLSKAEIARINGAKSRGPTSPEGKAKSSQNAVKHGLSAKQFMIMPADQDEFDAHLKAAIAHWNPQTDYELYLVTKLARVDFQHDRAEDILTSLIDLETDIIGPDIQKTFQTMDANGCLALGYKSLNDHSSAHRNMDRHVARLARERIQARKTLLETIEYRRKLEAEQAPVAEPAPVTEQTQQPPEPTAVTPIDTARPWPTTPHPFENEPTDIVDDSPENPKAS